MTDEEWISELKKQLKRGERIRIAFWVLVISFTLALILTMLEYYLKS